MRPGEAPAPARWSYPAFVVRWQSRAEDSAEEHSLAGLPTAVPHVALRQAAANTPAYGLAGLFDTPAGVSDQVAPGCLIHAQCCPLTAQRVCSWETTGWRFVPPDMPAATRRGPVFSRRSNFDSAQKRPRLPVMKSRDGILSGTPARRRRIAGREIIPVFERVRSLCAQEIRKLNVWGSDENQLNPRLECWNRCIARRCRDRGASNHGLFGCFPLGELDVAFKFQIAGDNTDGFSICRQREYTICAALKRVSPGQGGARKPIVSILVEPRNPVTAANFNLSIQQRVRDLHICCALRAVE